MPNRDGPMSPEMGLPSHPPDRRAPRPHRQRLATLAVLVAVWSAGSTLLLVVVLQQHVPVRDLLVDPATATSSAWYAGFVTSIGILAWSVATCACAATAYTTALAGRRGAASAFRGGSLLFGLLLLDDLFLLHSNVLPDLLGTSKLAMLAALGSLAVAWVVSALPELRRTRWELLFASAAAFGTSITVDVLVHGHEGGTRLLLEDGSKLLGVLALAAWSAASARDVIRSVVTPPPARPTPAHGSGAASGDRDGGSGQPQARPAPDRSRP